MSIWKKLFLSFLTALLPLAAWSQSYPQKPVKILVTIGPGSSADILARIVAEEMQRRLGQPFIVENRPGAGGNIAADVVAKSAPDGYTLLMSTISTHAINAALYPSMPFDPMKDFSHIALLAANPNALVVLPSSPIQSLKDVLELAAKKPQEVTYSSGGSGTSQHLAGELFKMQTGTVMQHIPYKGAAQAIPDLVSGQIQLMFVGIPEALPHIRSGKLRALGVTSRERSPVIPDTVPIAEQGFPDFDVSAWFGMVAPAGTPRDIVARFHAEIIKAIASKEVSTRFANVGLDPRTSASPDQFAGFIRQEIAKWAPVVTASGAKAD